MLNKIQPDPHPPQVSSIETFEQPGSERKMMTNEFIENVLDTFHEDDSIEITEFPDELLQAKIQKIMESLNQNATFNSPIGQLGHTNSVLMNVSPDEDVELFIPGYMRMKIRSLIKVDISSQQTQVNALISFSVHYGKLPRLLVDYLKQSLILRFSKKNSILLKETQDSELTIKVIEDDVLSLITFSIDLPLTFHFQPSYPFDFINIDMSIWLSPFQKINNVLTIKVQDLVIRYDDLMVEFAGQYSMDQFQEVESYFKHLKSFNGEIRKMIIKVNLMNFVEPDLAVSRLTQLPKLRKMPKGGRRMTNSLDVGEVTVSRLIRQKYEEMAQLYTAIESEGQVPMQKFRFNKAEMSKDFRIYELNHEISNLINLFGISPSRFTYQEEHLLGQYEIVSTEFNVKLSCYKYLKLKKKLEIYQKIYDYIREIRSSGFDKKSGIEPKQNKIIDKILLKQKITNDYSSNPEILPHFPSQIVFKDPAAASIKKIPMAMCTRTFTRQKPDQRGKIIREVANDMQKGKQGPKTFQFAHFQLSIYKHPFVPLAIVFFPLWIIATINLIIYFSPRDLSTRIANIATLLISYVAYFPIFREQIPEYRYLLLAEISAYLQIVCSFLTILHSVTYKEADPDAILNFDNVGAVFWVSFGLTMSTILIVMFAYLYHKCFIQPRYKRKQYKKPGTLALRHILWNNFECDFLFLKKSNFMHLEDCLDFETFLKQNYPNRKIRTVPMKLQRSCEE